MRLFSKRSRPFRNCHQPYEAVTRGSSTNTDRIVAGYLYIHTYRYVRVFWSLRGGEPAPARAPQLSSCASAVGGLQMVPFLASNDRMFVHAMAQSCSAVRLWVGIHEIPDPDGATEPEHSCIATIRYLVLVRTTEGQNRLIWAQGTTI